MKITAEWEQLDRGTPEERACFAALGIQCSDRWLTEGLDGVVNRVRSAPLLSAYHLAEWLTWNWWRLRWEPRSRAPDWVLAHRMSTIGEGYVWPNITIFSDGERTRLISKPTAARQMTAFRYVSDYAPEVPSSVFENAVDEFIVQVIGQLNAEKIASSNLNCLWSELIQERKDRDVSRRRKLEALLGHEPDGASEPEIQQLLHDARLLGEHAIEELAADSPPGTSVPTADDMKELANTYGYETNPSDAVRFTPGSLPALVDVPAWKLGAHAARALRAQEKLGAEPLSDSQLTSLAGVDPQTLSDKKAGPKISFALDRESSNGRIVLRPRWHTGRRFELARLLADRIVASPSGRLHPATRAYTYRQKMQRSFAAELLSPFEAVDQMLDGDYSPEAQADAAEHFQVSDRTIWTLLANNERIGRGEFDEDLGAAA